MSLITPHFFLFYYTHLILLKISIYALITIIEPNRNIRFFKSIIKLHKYKVHQSVLLINPFQKKQFLKLI